MQPRLRSAELGDIVKSMCGMTGEIFGSTEEISAAIIGNYGKTGGSCAAIFAVAQDARKLVKTAARFAVTGGKFTATAEICAGITAICGMTGTIKSE